MLRNLDVMFKGQLNQITEVARQINQTAVKTFDALEKVREKESLGGDPLRRKGQPGTTAADVQRMSLELEEETARKKVRINAAKDEALVRQEHITRGEIAKINKRFTDAEFKLKASLREEDLKRAIESNRIITEKNIEAGRSAELERVDRARIERLKEVAKAQNELNVETAKEEAQLVTAKVASGELDKAHTSLARQKIRLTELVANEKITQEEANKQYELTKTRLLSVGDAQNASGKKMVRAVKDQSTAIDEFNVREARRAILLGQGSAAQLKFAQVQRDLNKDVHAGLLTQDAANDRMVRARKVFFGGAEAVGATQRRLQGLRGELNEVGRVMRIALGPLSRAASAVTNFGILIESTSIKMAVAVGGFLLMAFGAVKAAKAYIEFEKGLVGVRKTTDLSAAGMEVLSDNFLRMSTRVNIGASELSGIAQIAGQMGIRGVEDIASFTEAIAILTKTTSLTGPDAATKIAQLLSITNEAANTAPRLASVIVDLGNKFAANESRIVEFGVDVARVGAAFGVTATQSLAMGTALAQLGANAESGSTAVGRLFAKMNEAIDEGGIRLQQFAEITDRSTLQFTELFRKDAMGAVLEFIKGLNLLQKQGASTAQVLKDLEIGGFREIKSLLPLAKG